jgi:hypothetical protein
MAIEVEKSFLNSGGEVIATLVFEQGWLLRPINDPQEYHFGTETEAWDYWRENFDVETGQRRVFEQRR